MTLSPEAILITAVATFIIELLVFLGGLYYFRKEWPTKKATADTERELTVEEVQQARLENQNRMLDMLFDRDAQIADLSMRLSALSAKISQIEVLEKKLEATQKELQMEREWRIRTEQLLTKEEAQSETYRQQRNDLEVKVHRLQERLSAVEQRINAEACVHASTCENNPANQPQKNTQE